MNKKKIIIIGAVIVFLGLGFLLLGKGGSHGQQVSMLEPSDIVKDFYDSWLNATRDPNAEPDKKTLAQSPLLSEELSNRLSQALKTSNVTPDPVLCQSVTPTDISIRNVFETPDKAEILVTSKDKKVTESATISFNKLNGGWYINDIKCSAGEFAPEREFSFEKVGYLLKDSIPAPYDKKNWHLVFEEDGTAGHVVPLLFDAKSQCTAFKGETAVCVPAQFVEAKKVSVQGQMTERGATITKLVFLE